MEILGVLFIYANKKLYGCGDRYLAKIQAKITSSLILYVQIGLEMSNTKFIDVAMFKNFR